jgi:hypothetical protein
MADLSNAGPARRRGGRGPAQGQGRGQPLPGLPVPAAGEGRVGLQDAVVQRHHQRARPDDRGEQRVRDPQHGRAGRPQQPGQRPGPVRREQRDVGADDVGVGRQLSQREKLRPPGVDQHPQRQPVLTGRQVSGQLDDRPGDTVRSGQAVHPRVDDHRPGVVRHDPASPSACQRQE